MSNLIAWVKLWGNVWGLWRVQNASKPHPSCFKNRSRNRKMPVVPGLKIDFFEKLPQVSRVAEMVAAKNCSNFWGEKIVQTSGAQIQANCPRMLRGRFWLQNQDFGASVGAICIIFRNLRLREKINGHPGPHPPGPVGTDRSRKMMQIAPTDAPKS